MRREITKLDFINEIGEVDNYQYQQAKKLTDDEIDLFYKANDLIESEVGFNYRGKNRRVIIVAVSIPDLMVTVYPTGEWNKHYNKEFATKYASFPYSIRLSIDGLMDFWTNKIKNVDFSNVIKPDKITHIRYDKIKNSKNYFH